MKRKEIGRRIHAWLTKQYKGQPDLDEVEVGVQFKPCDKCDRGDCTACAYKQEFEKLMALPNCNDCAHNPHSSCGVCPNPGDFVRVNCPLWRGREDVTNDDAGKAKNPEV